MAEKWTEQDIPDLSGQLFVVTGANTGLGLQTTRALASHGAQVVMACRSTERAESARQGLDASVRERTEVGRLDLSDLDSVRTFAEGLDGRPVTTLVNNAGVMIPPLGRTAQGHELQWGTNVLGHFLLTALLMPQVEDRVVWLSSLAHRHGAIDFDDPDWRTRKYNAMGAYGQSKLADLMLAYELERRLTAAGSLKRSLAAHPGYSATELQSRPGMGITGLVMGWVVRIPGLAQPAAMGALPSLFAAIVPDLPGGSFVGPDGRGETAGHPIVVGSSRASHDRNVAQRLWSLCEEQVGQTFEV